ncbi:M23 family metallopeptidase [Paeniglutamicibacter antarcticus]|uniref:M23 family metallopeptidase n=1 Tax=Arthrobacter terrae TaxID=2935737 RepID=A0A931G7V2_9MICC|nr:M23 family metallopeptidase [Arthrobacter terrae]
MSQKAGMVLAAAGLALAVTVPTTTPPLAGSVSDASPVVEPAVTAAAGAPLDFARPQVSSSLDADGKLHQTLAVSADHVTAAAAKGVLSAPLDSPQQTSGFGGRVNPLTGEMGELHTGQDYGVACGSAVHVAAGGTVTGAGWHPYGGGNRILVEHGNGLATTYNHLSEINVTVGQKLERGAQIALSGSTGASTGCHLHFEVTVDNAPVDPLGWL